MKHIYDDADIPPGASDSVVDKAKALIARGRNWTGMDGYMPLELSLALCDLAEKQARVVDAARKAQATGAFGPAPHPDALCHVGILAMEECVRCGPLLALRAALAALDEEEKECASPTCKVPGRRHR